MAYWDTSCLLKLYAPEPDSADFRLLVINGATVVTSEITRLGLWAALRRKEAANELVAGGARTALSAYDADVTAALVAVKEIDAATVSRFEAIVEHCCARSPLVPLRTLDAIHLSTATVSGELELVATDKRLREAGMSLGFRVYPPP